MLRSLSAFALALAAAFPSTVSATLACAENNQLTFTPALTESNQAGSVRIDFQGTCADAPGLVPSHYSGSHTFAYFGSCFAALIAEGGQSMIVGGTFYAFVRASNVKVLVVQPDATCPLQSAHGTGVHVKP